MSKKYEGRKIVLILGAGSTYNEGRSGKKPPLDKNFFSISRRTNKSDVEHIQKYFLRHYNLDICDGKQRYDSLEYVMVRLFVDSYDQSIGKMAFKNFFNLIKLFNSRLAYTTNGIKPNPWSKLHRLIFRFLDEGAEPKNMSIITFNQDILLEKTLDSIETRKKIKYLLNFPYCYKISPDDYTITSPNSSAETFTQGKTEKQGITILKLHGSLNWYSVHRAKDVAKKTIV